MKRLLIGLLAGLVLVVLGRHLQSSGDLLASDANTAFRQSNYATAAELYHQAEESASDRALVAHNHAASLFRLEHFDDSDHQYEQSASGSDFRSARAAYDRGNCALAQAMHGDSTDHALVLKAVEQYRIALQQEGSIPEAQQVFTDARHNLELAKRLLSEEHDATNKESAEQKKADGTPEEECPLCKAEREGLSWNTRGQDPFDPKNSADSRENKAANERPLQHSPT